MTDSEAVRTALIESAARRRARSSIAAEVERLGRSAGRLDAGELRAVDDALALVLGL
jgi:hypothetical protein